MKYICEYCVYETNRKNDYKKHIYSTMHLTKIQNEISVNKHKCEICNYSSFNYANYSRHLKSKKHNTTYELFNNTIQDLNHKIEKLEESNHKQLVEMKNNMLEIKDKINEITDTTCTPATAVVITQNNTTTINNFSLNLFLNNTCKDAMNIEDFTKKIEITYDDLHSIFLRGYTTAMTEILTNNLNKLDENKRPIHCSDIKRTIIHTKTNDKWEKDSGHIITKEMISTVGKKTQKKVGNWKQDNESSINHSDPNFDNFCTLIKNVNNQYEEPVTDKIIKKLVKYIPIQKGK